jgi:hypothetical protein
LRDKNYFHILRSNKALKLQNAFIFVDTESFVEKNEGNIQNLSFKLGTAIFWNRADYKDNRTYYDPTSFWDDLESWETKQVCLFAHNMQFDFKMLNGFQELINRKWNLDHFYFNNGIFIMKWSKLSKYLKDNKGNPIKKVLNIWDTFNYARMSVDKIGESLGVAKLKIDFEKCSDKELETYCLRDTEILYLFIKKLCDFLQEHNLSKLKSTAGSLSMNIFRHAFYQEKEKPIYIHNVKKAIDLERESYKGGITDVFNLNTIEKCYKMDINSMYPYIMKNERLPTKLVAYFNHSLSQHKLHRIMKRVNANNYGVIVDALVKIPKEYAYILNKFNKCMFSYGMFRITVCKPELDFIAKYGKVIYYYQINVYEMDNFLSEFISFFYEKRLEYKKEGNMAYEQFCKLVMNNLYGKFAQRKIVKHIFGESEKDNKFFIKNQDVIEIMLEKNKQYIGLPVVYLGTITNEGEIYIVNNRLIHQVQTQENAIESFVAVSSFITSHARMLLIDYLLTAKRKNVYYCDTDSLFTNQEGYDLLKQNNLISENNLGMLKIEGIGKAKFYAPKFYDFENERKAKGIKKNSKILDDNSEFTLYENEIWDKLKSDLKHGNLNQQIITLDKKKLSKTYDKGNIINNIVYPYHIREINTN